MSATNLFIELKYKCCAENVNVWAARYYGIFFKCTAIDFDFKSKRIMQNQMHFTGPGETCHGQWRDRQWKLGKMRWR